MRYFIANWKANKNLNEALDWIDKFLNLPSRYDRIKMVVCPPFHLIHPLKLKLRDNKFISLGTQDVSVFESGNYTGEVTAKSLKGLIDYAIIGHSERRKYFQESDEVLTKKVQLALKYEIQPVYCVRGEKDSIPENIKIVAYEPVYAIGTGQNEDVEKVIEVKKKLNLSEKVSFLYGGSITESNAQDYLVNSYIDGLLIGGSSLDPDEFFKIIKLG
ncbi:triosephosphate isomerase [Candidatus Roizmanbacteria bacterium]|nr:triosephosphate isomerase [Candidatus Roizmanbacteria bacterium]